MNGFLPVTADQLDAMLERAARRGAEQALAALLPPFSQTSPPAGVSSRAFLAACRAGCPHTRRGRTLLVERSAWQTWTATHVRRAPQAVRVSAHPAPANEPTLDLAALLNEALRGR